MPGPFTPKTSPIPLIPNSTEPVAPDVKKKQFEGLSLPAPKPKRKQCSLYLDAEMMEQVKRVARRRGVAIGAVIEACVRLALEQMEG